MKLFIDQKRINFFHWAGHWSSCMLLGSCLQTHYPSSDHFSSFWLLKVVSIRWRFSTKILRYFLTRYKFYYITDIIYDTFYMHDHLPRYSNFRFYKVQSYRSVTFNLNSSLTKQSGHASALVYELTYLL